MDTVFTPQRYNRTHCSRCGAARVAHDYFTKACPKGYRPDTLTLARQELRTALASGVQERIFVARGEVQRLGGNPDDE